MSSVIRIGLAAAFLLLGAASPAVPQQERVVTALRGEIEVEPVQGSLLSRPAELAIARVTVPKALTLLSTAARISVAFSPTVLPADLLVDCSCEEVSIAEALDRILSGTEFGYRELDDQIVIVKRGPVIPALRALPVRVATTTPGVGRMASGGGSITVQRSRAVQEAVVGGTVVDARNGAPIEGAQVSVVGTQMGVLTNDAGEFRITGLRSTSVELEVIMLGYRSERRSVEVGTTDLRIAVTESVIDLDGLVVTATGEARAREIGTSVARITSREIDNAIVRDVEEVITGRVPGAVVIRNSGQPGAGGAIRLRGANSISQGNEPIVYIDGIRISGGGSAPRQPATNQSPSPLLDIDPAVIDRVEIIKGAAATTLYGTEASSGVIQIFTKRGRASSEAKWTAEVTAGFNNIGHVGPEEDETGLWLNQCRGPGLVGYDGRVFEDPTCPSSGSWLRNGAIQRYNLSVDGGSERVKYFVGANYSSEDGVIHSVGGTRDGGASANLNITPWESLDLSLSSRFVRRSTEWVPSGQGNDAFLVNVTRGFAGNYAGADGCSGDVVCVANAEVLRKENVTEGNHFTSGLSVTHRLSPEINNRLAIGYDFNSARLESVTPFGQQRFPLGEIMVTDWTRTLLSVEYVGSYQKELSESLHSTFSWGGQLFSDHNQTRAVEAFDFSGPGEPTLTSAARRDVVMDERLRVTNAGFFAQEKVAWRDRLYLTGGVRLDGNSAFGKSFGLQTYPKLSASYMLSEHDFWPVDWWDVLKLRGAVGESGKAPGAFDAVQTWDPVAADDGNPAFTPGLRGNPDLGPERSREVEIGFETSIMQGRFSVDFTQYWQRTTDALLPVQFPPSMGFAARQLKNVGELKNWGYEARISADIIRSPQLYWRVRADFSENHNEAVDLNGEEITVHGSSRTYVREGYPVPSYFGNKITNPNELADPAIEEDAYLGTPYPTQTIALGSHLEIGTRLAFDVLGEFHLGGHLLNNPAYQNGRKGAWPACYDVQRKDLASRSSNPSALDDVPALWRARCALDDSEIRRDRVYWIESSNFFRLRNLAATYRLPETLVPGTRSAVLGLAASNLFTSTSYSGTDPEVDDVVNSLGRRDYYVIPTYRTFTASLRVTF